ncbi:OVARIAN TUMOR DOMAIN-containing deubiquitinating enzyme 4-like [Mercurialis annua]|uniref:OVARIAN TUMOR DOMAIN-containing deubiquitinating enzyme 4-like n=1 Tax=Mercurialis annua TaxID=3986 RepID=UPI00215EDF55|nr:OVARIAN TUMOR DOMAIN-containing deubiquitinating enzyme 4-like [Mercurialis annua]
MLGVLCARSKLSILTHLHAFSLYNHRLSQPPAAFSSTSSASTLQPHHSSGCAASAAAAASIWRVIQPSSGFKNKKRRKTRGDVERLLLAVEPRGEGSWNVAWDARPARWLHRPDSAWLLFGVCGVDCRSGVNPEIAVSDGKESDGDETLSCDVRHDDDGSNDYKVTGVLADGRCLFRAIAHGACLRSGEEAPDENRQRELADELRAQVVNELLTRREETEWFIEGDFDAYVKTIQQPFVWGGEPELLMASHVLKTMISVFMIDRTSGNLVNIANYGEDYRRDDVNPINVLFHRYGHYDTLENLGQSYQKVNL